MNTLQTLEAALSAERETKRLIIADWDRAEHRARQRQNQLEAEIAALERENAALRAGVESAFRLLSTCIHDHWDEAHLENAYAALSAIEKGEAQP